VTIEANPFRRFEGSGGGNNNPPSRNNNNNNLSPLPLLGFGKDLEGGFNPSFGKNVGGLDPNIAVLVNALTGVNLGINYIERESNHMKPTEFEETEAEDLNE